MLMRISSHWLILRKVFFGLTVVERTMFLWLFHLLVNIQCCLEQRANAMFYKKFGLIQMRTDKHLEP